MSDDIDARHDPGEVVGECEECGDDVTRADRVTANAYAVEFCSTDCRHAWKSHTEGWYV